MTTVLVKLPKPTAQKLLDFIEYQVDILGFHQTADDKVFMGALKDALAEKPLEKRA